MDRGVSVCGCNFRLSRTVDRGSWQSNTAATTLAPNWKIYRDSPYGRHSVRPAIAVQYHGYQKFPVAQVLRFGWWRKPSLFCRVVVLGSKILHRLDALSLGQACFPVGFAVRTEPRRKQRPGAGCILVRRIHCSCILQHVVSRSAHAVRTQTCMTESRYRLNCAGGNAYSSRARKKQEVSPRRKKCVKIAFGKFRAVSVVVQICQCRNTSIHYSYSRLALSACKILLLLLLQCMTHHHNSVQNASPMFSA